MGFGPWYPLADAGAEAPASPGVFQVRLGRGLLAYPRGRSAMLRYAAAADVRAAAVAFAAAHPGREWLCRHAETADVAAAEAYCERLRERFRRQFGGLPRAPAAELLRSFTLRLAAAHARLVWADGMTRDLDGAALAALTRAAAPLIAALAAGGAVRAVSVDLERGVLRATIAGEGGVEVLRVDGARFARELAPLCAAVSATCATARG
jgi:hypothetical protein